MNLGLLGKTAREVWAVALICGLGVMAFEALLAYVYANFFEELTKGVFNVRFVQYVLRALVGADFGDNLRPGTLVAVAWVHPVLLALLWVQEITFWTRMPAAEVDRGTIDVLLGLPVSRWRVYLSETAVWLVSGLGIIGMALIGGLLGGLTTSPDMRANPGRLVVVGANLYCLYLAVGGLTCLVSALSDRRGRAVAVALGIVLGTFLLNFLSPFWKPAETVSFLGALTYYRPLDVLGEAAWPLTDMALLALVGAALWAAGGVAFARRDICTD